MAVFIALLRAVNVGGTGKLPMADLKSLCEAAGFARVRTYIASGNVVFESHLETSQARLALEARLGEHVGKPVGVVIRTPAQMREVLKRNPFPQAAPNRNVVIFFDAPLPVDCLEDVRGRKDEELQRAEREIHVHYDVGMAKTKLVIPIAKRGTARNVNTLAKLVEIADQYREPRQKP
jgi:uncharacterized protein (DUF1697 family)